MDGPPPLDVPPPPPPLPPPIPVHLPEESVEDQLVHEKKQLVPVTLTPAAVDDFTYDEDVFLSVPRILVTTDESKGPSKVRLNQYQVILMKKGRTGSEMFRTWRTRRFILSQQTFYYYHETVLKGSINVYKSTSYAISAPEIPEVKNKKYPFLMKTAEGEVVLFSADNEPTRQKTIFLLNFAARDMSWSYDPNEIYTYQSPMLSSSHLQDDNISVSAFQDNSPMRLRLPPPVPPTAAPHQRSVSTTNPSSNPFDTNNSSPLPSRPPPPIAHNPLNTARYLTPQGPRRPSTLASAPPPVSPLFTDPYENPRYVSPLRAPPVVPPSVPSPLLMEAYKEKFSPSPVPESSPPPVPPPIPVEASDPLHSTEDPPLPATAPPPPPIARTTSISPVPPIRRLIAEAPSPLKWLLYVGVKIEHAKSMLEQSKNDPKLALQKINHKIMSNTMLGYLYWFQRFDVRISAYTPNCTDEETKEVYTGYTTCVNFQKLAENRMISWQMVLKFSSFQRLEGQIKRFSSLSGKVLLPVMKKGIFSGETDAMRIERMTRLNNWIHDLVSEILLMTVADFVDIIFEFLDIETQVGLDDIYQLREE